MPMIWFFRRRRGTGRALIPRRRCFYEACEHAGLTETVEVDGEMVERPKQGPYDLRHFYASVLIAQRTNLKRLQKLMGMKTFR